jgi:hypothetical protein
MAEDIYSSDIAMVASNVGLTKQILTCASKRY